MTNAERDQERSAPIPRQTNINTHQNSGIIVGENTGTLDVRNVSGNAPLPPAADEPAPAAAAPVPATPALRILFLGASPQGAPALRLDHEVREIDQALRQAEFRDRFDLKQQLAVRVADLQTALLRHRPQIVHFSGHGEVDGVFLEDEGGRLQRVPGTALARILAVFKKQIRCVVLNACFSQEQAEAIAKDIDCVVGMSTSIGDRAAIRFAPAFYQALAFGSSVRTAFDLGCAQIDLDGLGEGTTPQLVALRTDPDEIVFVDPG